MNTSSSKPALRRRSLFAASLARLRFASRQRLLAGLLALGAAGSVHGQTVFTYTSTTTNGNWSTPANWSSTTYPGANGAATTDVANLINTNSAGTNQINYDATASGYVGTLNYYNTTTTGNTSSLTLMRDLTINNALTLYNTGVAGTANRAATAGIILGTTAAARTLTIAAGATFTIGGTNLQNVGTGNYLYTASTGGTVALNGTVTVSAASVFNNSATPTVATTFIPTLGAASTNPVNWTLGSAGIAQIDSEASTLGSRLLFTGNFSAATGATLESTTGNNGGSAGVATNNAFFFQGSTNTFASGVNFTTITAGTSSSGFTSAAEIVLSPTTLTSQTTTTASLLPIFTSRDVNAGTSTNQVTTTETFSSTATSGTISNAVPNVTLYNSVTYGTSVFQLGSNLNLSAGTTPFTFNFPATSTGDITVIDLHGFAYNATTSASTTTFTPTATVYGSSTAITGAQLRINNTGTSSLANNQGVFQVGRFVLTGEDVGIGAGVILQAAGTGANDLGTPTGGTSTIDAASTFYYTGAGTGTLASTNGRSVGIVTVGSGTSASTLQLTSAITTQGLTTVNTNAILDTAGLAYTTTGLSGGGGRIQNGSTATAASTFTINNVGTNTYAGSLTDNTATGTNYLNLTLGSTSTGTQILSGTSNYRGTTTVNGGTLLFTGTSAGGGAYTVNSGGRLGGAGGSITTSGITVNTGGGMNISGGGTVTPGVLTVVLGANQSLSLSGAAGNNSGELVFVLGSNGGTSDRVNLSGATATLNIGTGALNLSDFSLSAGSTFGVGTYVLFDTASSTGITGSLAAGNLAGSLAGYSTRLSQSTDASGNADLILSVTAVPEPSGIVFALAAVSVFAFQFGRQARRKRVS